GNSLIIIAECDGKSYLYSWYRDGGLITENSSKTLSIKDGGSYYVTITNENGCSVGSDTIILKRIDKPMPWIKCNNSLIENDTVVKLCSGERVILKAGGGDSIVWRKDGAFISHFQDTLSIDLPGIYDALTINAGICYNNTKSVKIETIKDSIYFSKDTLRFLIKSEEQFNEQIVSFLNKSDDTLSLDSSDIYLPQSYTIISPDFPAIIDPDKSIDLTIRSNQKAAGISYDSMTIKKRCGGLEKLFLITEKEHGRLQSDGPKYIFPPKVSCDTSESIIYIKLYNSGNDSINNISCKAANPFYTDSAIFPLHLAPLDSSRVPVYLKYIGEGILNELLMIEYATGGITDSLFVTLEAQSALPHFRIKIDKDDFGILSECTDSISGTIKMLNDGIFPIEIKEQSLSKDFQLINLPVLINPDDSVELNYVYFTKRFGKNIDSIQINAEPCGISELFTLAYIKDSVSNNSDKNVVDFGAVKWCGSLVILRDTVQLYIKSLFDLSASLEKYGQCGDLSVEIQNSQKLKDTNLVLIEYNPSVDGKFDCGANITITPCGRTFTIQIIGERVTPSFTIMNNLIDFGMVKIGDSKADSVEIFNNSTVSIQIDSVTTDNTKFKIIDSSSLPYLLSAGNSLWLHINYSPDDEADDTAKVTVHSSKPCLITKSFICTGRGNKIVDKLEFLIDNFTAEEGEVFSIPLIIKYGSGTTDFSKIESIRFNVNYLTEILSFIDAKCMNKQIYSNSFDFSENVIGKVRFNISNLNESGLNEELLLSLRFEALTGIISGSEITIDSIIVQPDNAEFTTKNGVVIVKHKCGNRPPIDISGTFEISVSNTFITENIININFAVSSEDYTTLELLDIYGSKAECLLSDRLNPGEYSISYNTFRVSSGLYFLVLKSGNFSKSKKIYIIKGSRE
ncbi:MAG: large repetitive protein, partial [Bacteroidota bacterium]|nr:large repetitive protein [Bacteroidota bacterium]